MTDILTAQQLHNFSMNKVAEFIQKENYEILDASSDINQNPQFVVKKNDNLYFVVVQTTTYPKNPNEYDTDFMKLMSEHAKKHNAKLLFAGVGLVDIMNMNSPLTKNSNIVVKFDGLKQIN